MIKQILKQVSIKVPEDFKPVVSFGSNVSVGTMLGRGTKYRVLEEYCFPDRKVVNVDEGIYIRRGEKIFGNIRAKHEGLVKIVNNCVQIVEILPDEPIYSDLMGKVLLIGNGEIVLETRFMILPMFISKGQYVKSHLAILDLNSTLVTVKDVDERVTDRILIVPGALTYKLYQSAMNFGAVGVVAASIDWIEYTKLLKEFKKQFNFGILQGFGTLAIWNFYRYIFTNLASSYVEIDFKESLIYLPFYDIMYPEKMLISFKLGFWGKRINKIEEIGGKSFADTMQGEKLLISSDEIQQLIF